MDVPKPRIGAVIRHAFLWSDESKSGHDEGMKDRSAAIVLSKRQDETGDTQVWVVPVTHAPPVDPETSIEIPPDVCKSLGLDGDRHWLRADELNRFLWPGHDLRPIPGKNGGVMYGMLPQALYEMLRSRILDLYEARKLADTKRD